MKHSKSPTAKHRARVLGALFLVFWATATLTFGARRMLGRSLDNQPSQNELSSARDELASAIPRLPADTEEKLASALEPTIAPVNVSSDPFSDRAGIANPNQIIQSSSKSMNMISTGPVGPVVPLIPDRMARLSQWQQSVRAAALSHQTLPPITNAYLITEMAPSGKFNINGHLGAWLYIDAEKRTIAANVGSKFYDGMLVGVSESGVQFRTSANQTRTIPWARQDDFGTPTMPVDPRPAFQGPTNSPPKPISDVRGPGNFRRVTIQNEYDDLQVAVKDRYAKNTVVQPSPEAPASNNAIKPATVATNDEDKQSSRQNFNHANRTVALTSDENPIYLETAEIVSSTPLPTPVASPSPSPATSPAIAKAESSTAQTVPPVSAPKKETGSPALSASVDTPASRSKADAPSTAAKSEPINMLCESGYRGDKISISNESGRPLSLLTFVNRLNADYGANIVLDYDIQETPVRLTINDAPWTSILRTILDLNDLDAVCVDGHIAQVAKRSKIAQISEQRRKNAPIVREVFKLRYLQPTAGGRTNLAGQTQSSNGANIQTLEAAIRDILKAGGDSRGDARQVPGHNEIFVAATQEQMGEIRSLIERVDRPGYQVKISALVYTANDNRLRDIGSQLSIAAFSLNNNNIGGISSLPNNSGTPGTGSGSGSGSGTGTGNNGSGAAGSNPGGIPGLLSGMRQPSNGLGATNPLITIGGGMVFPSGQFALQITAAQQSGAINIQSRPFGLVADGETLDLNAGIQIPVVTTTIAGGAPFQSGQVQFIEASRLTQINPQVAEDDQGRPAFVTLNLRLENNSVDTSLGTFNGIPGVNRQSLQTVLRLRNGETAVIGGLAADQVSNASSKVPGVGDLPIIGHLFKRKQTQQNTDRLYFAITVEVVPQDAAIPGFPAPADAITSQPQPPTAMKPSPFEKHH
jgi:Flp pilus assembly secretin CpaC